MNDPQKIVILGAGLAGLSAGYELAKAGKKVVILEKNSYVGGLATTFKVGHYRFDTGPHRWFTKINEIDKWVRDLMGDELINVKRLTRIYFNHKYFLYPMQPINALLGIGPVRAVQSVIDYFIVKIKTRIFPKPVVSMEDAYIQQFGKTLYEIFFKNYSEKLWGRPCNKLSGDWVSQRSRGMSITTIIKDAFFPSKGKVVSLVEEFSYPKLGVGRIAERLAEEIRKMGGEIVLNAKISKIKYQKSKIQSVIYKNNDEDIEIGGDEFISSIPMTDLVTCLAPDSNNITKEVKTLSYRAEIFVVLFIKRDKISPDQWIYAQDSTLPFVRFLETDNWSFNMSPKGTTSLVFEVACDKADKYWNDSDKNLTEWVIDKYINEFKTINKNDIFGSFVHRQENEYPIYRVGYEKPLNTIKEFLKKYKNLQIIGRAGMYRYNNMDHTIQSGIWAARNLTGGNYNLENINTEKEYHEQKKSV
jgi:protoporphyrinogen oxidase